MPRKKSSTKKASTKATTKKKKAPLKKRVLTVINPATGEKVAEVPMADKKEVEEKVQKAKEAFLFWSKLPFRERAKYILKAKDYMLENLDEIARRIQEETGKVYMEVMTHELFGPIDLMNYYAKKGEKELRPEKIRLHAFPHKTSWIYYKPRGVVAIISPWNFPFTIPMGEVVISLLTGNTVILKPSEITPLTGLLIEEIFQKVGLPEGVMQTVIGDGEVGSYLIDSDIQYCIFTGSVRTGKLIAEKLASRLIPYTLELGGKDPMLILPSADVEEVAHKAVWGAFANAGQVCASIERVYVPHELYQPFVEKVVEETRKLLESDDLGPIISPMQLKTIKKHIQDAKRKGAEVLIGGKEKKGTKGRFFEPTVLAPCNHSMLVMKEETFGPVMPIMPYHDIEEGIALANDSVYGLTASVWGKPREARKVASFLEAGTVYVNDHLYSHAACETPWGGVKQSGIGRVHSKIGFKELTEPIHYNYPKPLPLSLWYYPYTKKKYLFLRNYLYLMTGNLFYKLKALFYILTGIRKAP